MEDLSRRKLMTSTSLGLAAAGALAIARPVHGGTGELTPPRIDALDGPVVAHVEDLASGRVLLFTGERAVSVVDHTLAQHLARHVS